METSSYSVLTSEYENYLVSLFPRSYLLNIGPNSTDEFFSSNISQIILPVATDGIVSSLTNKTTSASMKSNVGVFESKLIIPLYVIIFLLAVIGNSFVVITLAQNKRMRTVTNVYLLNLAVSDLLLGVFCMPFTLVGQVLRNFIFGAVMCKLIPYIQAVSVSVGVWTLVAISLERYFAICRPLKSRRWQTQFHAYKMIALVWTASLTWTSPILAVSTLKAMRSKGHKCREEWPSRASEQAYNLFLDGILLLMPLLVMTIAYSLIVRKLWKGLQREIKHNSSCQRQMERYNSSANMNAVTLLQTDTNPSTNNSTISNTPMPTNRKDTMSPSRTNTKSITEREISSKDDTQEKAKAVKKWLFSGKVKVSAPSSGKAGSSDIRTKPTSSREDTGEPVETTYKFARQAIRSNYMDKSIEAKKNVIRMLFVIIAEFFICWAPLHVLNTVYLFSPELLYNYIGSTGVSLVQLLAYVSSCCNPVTYCFMNKKFRQAFLAIFNCYTFANACCPCVRSPVNGQSRCANRTSAGRGGNTPQNASEVSGNDSTIYMGRASTLCRSGDRSSARRCIVPLPHQLGSVRSCGSASGTLRVESQLFRSTSF